MADVIAPFHRLSDSTEVERPSWSLRVMQAHFALAGIVLFFGALGLVATLYQEFDSVDLGWNLRLERTGKIYEAGTQVKLLVALVLAGASVVQLQAVKFLHQRRRGAVSRARAAALMLVGGIPVAWYVWGLELDVPGLPVTLVRQVVRVGAVLLALQGLVAVWHLVRLMSPVGAESLEDETGNRLLRRVRQTVIVLWLALVFVTGLTLGVLTDWIYELPVSEPDPGALLYATSFDDSTDFAEWDTYTGRDSAQLIPVDDLDLGEGQDRSLTGNALVIAYGSPYTNQVVFSSPHRKFNDLDLRVTARPVSGPADNQYGVFFRYRDRENYYGFFISGDGYYSLVKRQDGVFSEISAWGESDAIRQGKAANEIRVVARGDMFRFFINNQPVPLCLRGDNLTSMWTGPGECYTDELTYTYRDSDFKQGRVALAAGSSVDLSEAVVVAFDDLIILGPDPDVVEH
jgi:hypothetical protein